MDNCYIDNPIPSSNLPKISTKHTNWRPITIIEMVLYDIDGNKIITFDVPQIDNNCECVEEADSK